MSETMRRGEACFRGKRISLVEPDPGQIFITDIAHALAHTCRWAGWTRVFYSTAEHSVEVARALPPEKRLAGLIHDAQEFVVGDLVAPLKELLPGYRAIEDRLQLAIFTKYRVAWPVDPEVHAVDLRIRSDERLQLLGERPGPDDPAPLGITLACHTPAVAEREFLRLFFDLYGRQSLTA